MRQLLSTALVACIVGALAGASFGAVAQVPAEPPVSTTALNADTVDGLSAVKATNKKTRRRNRLVATDAKGFLPSNIIKAKWGLIAGKPAFLADGLVGWNEVQGIPAALADGQVGWGEVGGKPAFLADGQVGWNEVAGIPGALADGQVGWSEVQGIPAGFADGVDNGAFFSKVFGPYVGPWGSGAEVTVSMDSSPMQDIDCYAVPSAGGVSWLGPEVRTSWLTDRVNRQFTFKTFSAGAGTLSIRCRSFYTEAIATSALKKAIKNAKVKIRKNARRR